MLKWNKNEEFRTLNIEMIYPSIRNISDAQQSEYFPDCPKTSTWGGIWTHDLLIACPMLSQLIFYFKMIFGPKMEKMHF